jgi:hypothetical protein
MPVIRVPPIMPSSDLMIPAETGHARLARIAPRNI